MYPHFVFITAIIWFNIYFKFCRYELDVLVLYTFALCLFGMKIYRLNPEDISCV
jgi:hypothetical protein